MQELAGLLDRIDRLLENPEGSSLSPAERNQLALCRSAVAFIREARAAAPDMPGPSASASPAGAKPSPAGTAAAPLDAGSRPEPPAGTGPRLVIIEDDPEFRGALVRFFSPRYECASFGDAESALIALGQNPSVAAFLLDYRLPGMTGVEFLAAAVRRFPLGGTPAILLTSLDDASIEVEAYEVGGVNFLRKPCEPEAVKLRLDAALKNAREVEERTKSLLRAKLARAMDLGGPPGSPLDEEALRRFKLSAREIDVLRLLANGLQAKEIADGLGLSPHTVINHLRNSYEKCGVSNRIELLRKLGRP